VPDGAAWTARSSEHHGVRTEAAVAALRRSLQRPPIEPRSTYARAGRACCAVLAAAGGAGSKVCSEAHALSAAAVASVAIAALMRASA
jgi:hypothetical protein